MQLYVHGKSKKEINERIAAGSPVYGENFSMFGEAGSYALNGDLAKGTVIKIFEKQVSGTPYAKAYGTWDGQKVK